MSIWDVTKIDKNGLYANQDIKKGTKIIEYKGKIITARAPRPSSEEVRKFIDGHLEKPKVMKFTSS